MADESTPPSPVESPPARRAKSSPRKDGAASRSKESSDAPSAPEKGSKSKSKSDPEARIPKRAVLAPGVAAHLRLRKVIDGRRPIFGRQAANRYYRIGRDLSWRRPRGLQSKQRRHYGYRAKIVRVGYGSPADVRGLVPSGYRPVIVHHVDELKALDPKLEAAIIARRVGTRRRLVLEESARKLGVRVLNPIATPSEE
jgi:large subunit ribosomal protein L32e